ncbi:UDP-4-amino-4,6-dideoxy-N-acetyl-beta-L-altrosamine transaminase [Bacillus sp. M6-12]|uniref:UDP-4-amino-4, 6-dideoxy-N-acetyl-beta-L-altrosamine transaminase n=1 Tax=Bacillus sp. M6-12 TaxID=2054166 RepID=UPI000C765AAB|nr:UDP-4-amino-4,6-dideoxy-N-acetyl-beta-L-altrosamine transaminase [Bacillus sp. M6-12]PLS17894.1 UDP-4-amino-4,6-dideoxy-N-acetyl-beta-L-altrosamine transaminase [Bacillus sp. M6-12]
MTLAIFGGKPVRNTFLSYGQQWIDEEDIQAVVDTLKSPFLTQGPAIEKYEKAVAEYAGAKYAVAFANGTAALHGACYAAGIGNGDEVVTTPMTFVATSNSVLYVGGKPVFADIDNQTYNISPAAIERAITRKTKAVIAVDYTGQPAALHEIKDICARLNLIFIEDAAHSLGATYRNEKVGSQADMTMFSFHPVKHITTGEGGIIVTNSLEYADKLRLFRSHGVTRDNSDEDKGPWYYEMVDLGMNYRMTDIQAELGISQLRKIDSFVKRRRDIAAAYNGQFQSLKEVTVPYQEAVSESSWHLYMLRLNLDMLRVGRREIFEALRAENIGVHVHYIPVYYQPYYRELGYGKGLCPVAEKWYEEALTIPLFPKMTDQDVESVIQGVTKVIKYFSK